MNKKTQIIFLTFFAIISLNFLYGQPSKQQTEDRKIVVKLEDNNDEGFDKYFKYFIDLTTPTLALIGLIITIPILRKKLLENHISKALTDIQDANKKVLSITTDLIDEYTPKTFTNDRVLKNELIEISEKIKTIYKNSQEGSSDSQTMLFFLKHTLQNTIKHYDPPQTSSILSTREVYGLVLYTLDYVTFFSTQVVNVPKSTKINVENLINIKIKKYVTNSEFLRYKYFKQGLIDDPNSAHFLLFYSQINEISNTLLKRSAFQIFWNISAIKKILYLSELYAPLEIIAPNNNSSIFGEENDKLYLIGFTKKVSLQLNEGKSKSVVELIYSNPNDFGRFASNLKREYLQKNFIDNFITNSEFSIKKAISMVPRGIETFSLEYDTDYLQQLYKKNKSKFKSKLN